MKENTQKKIEKLVTLGGFSNPRKKILAWFTLVNFAPTFGMSVCLSLEFQGNWHYIFWIS